MGSNSEWVWVKVVLMFVVLILQGWWSEGCWEKERFALLQLKHFFDDPSDFLTDWVEGDENSNCCHWKRVSCSNTTGKVNELRLYETKNWDVGERYLNISLFTHFQELEWLDLSANNITGCLENEGFERLSKLSNLKILDLCENSFNSSILSSLDGLLSLRELNLDDNNLNRTGAVKGFERLSKLRNLKILNLSENSFNSSILSSLDGLLSLRELYLYGNNLNGTGAVKDIQRLLKLRNLQILDLSENSLDNNILSSLKNFSSLRELYLGFNSLNGTIDIKELDSLNNLEVLDMGSNSIDGFLVPTGLRRLPKLRNLQILHLQGNSLDNSILSSLKNYLKLRELYLSRNSLNGTIDITELDSLNNLKVLDMSYNSIDNFLVPKGLRKLKTIFLSSVEIRHGRTLLQSMGSLPSLKTLDLSFNYFTRTSIAHNQELLYNFTNIEDLQLDESEFHISLLQSIAAFTSLKRLSMISCQINGDLRGQGFLNFKNLEYLFMNNTEFGTNVFQIIKSMPSLKVLSLTNSSLQSTIFDQGLCELVHLQELHLDDNKLEGTLPWCMANMTSLQVLDVSGNQLEGTLPWCLANMTSLQVLDVSGNQLTGDISSSPLKCLTFIQDLRLSNNHFRIPLSLRPFYNHSNLKSFYGENNQIYAEAESHTLAPKFQLNSIGMSGTPCDGSTFPIFLHHQQDLEEVDFSHMNLHGEFPSWLLENNPKLVVLYLVNNSLSGPFRMPVHPHVNLIGLYISNNHLQGHIPKEIGIFLPGLSYVEMANNYFDGPIPIEFCQHYNLHILDLTNNHISGNLPSCLTTPYVLHLSGNKIEGLVKDVLLTTYSRLTVLDLSHNHLNDTIFNWINGLSNLRYLILANNNLKGEMLVQLCLLKQLQLIDLSSNNLSGQIPHCLVNTVLNVEYDDPTPDFLLFVDTIKFTTKKITYTYEGKPLKSMCGIDLSHNQLVGEIPPQIGNLTMIHALNLSYNNLSGRIPVTFSNLKQIESLDLSHNNLDGKIPPQLVELDSLAFFSVAYNKLSGKIPERIAQFATFNESSYEGNPLLCGLPLLKSCNGSGSPSTSADNEEIETTLVDMDSFYITFTASYIIVFLGVVGVLYLNPYWRRRWFYFVELWITSCYYFVVDHLPVRF